MIALSVVTALRYVSLGSSRVVQERGVRIELVAASLRIVLSEHSLVARGTLLPNVGASGALLFFGSIAANLLSLVELTRRLRRHDYLEHLVFVELWRRRYRTIKHSSCPQHLLVFLQLRVSDGLPLQAKRLLVTAEVLPARNVCTRDICL